MLKRTLEHATRLVARGAARGQGSTGRLKGSVTGGTK